MREHYATEVDTAVRRQATTLFVSLELSRAKWLVTSSARGYKNRVNVDRRHKLIRRYAVTDAAEHDSRQLDGLLRRGNTSRDVFGDSAYRSAAAEAQLTAQGFRSRIHVRATRGHPLSKARAAANRAKSRIRARIEHVFGAQQTAPGGRLVRTIGLVRARTKIGLQNFVYNIRRLVTLERMAAA